MSRLLNDWGSMAGRVGVVAVVAACVGLSPGTARAQDSQPDDPWFKRLAADPDDPAVKLFASHQKKRAAAEKEMKKLRHKYFGPVTNTEIRQIGILKLKDYTDPALFPSLLEIFKGEKQDVRGAILDHLADQKTDDADTTLAWAAVFDEDSWFRAEATHRLLTRIGTSAKVPGRVRTVIAEGLSRQDDDVIAAAANLAGALKLYEAIPMLISGQIGGQAAGVDTGRRGGGALAYILVGKQQAFISDLTPVVGDNAVAFDPTLSVVTSGTVLRVIDAYVITYRVEVHYALVGLSSAGWGGRSTAYLGWDNRAWVKWYKDEFLPYRAGFAAEAAAKAQLTQGPK